MRLLTVMNIFSAETIQALCWTLVHSLWQGLLLAAVVALIVLFTKKSTAAFRYNLFTGSFILFILTVIATFYLHANSTAAAAGAAAAQLTGNTDTQHAVIIQQGFRVKASAGLDALAAFFNEYAAVIVFGWLLIISLKSVKLFAGFYHIHRIKNRNTSSVGSYWSLRVQQLSAGLGIKGHVQFLQSGLIKVPMVIGHFKPVIFFPLGALTALAPEDVEAILMHELAHIRRRDYLVNILQHVAEIIFFFNPAVLWVSALIKTERENCCDDIALSRTGNKKTYINALVSFQEFDAAMPAYATAFSNKKEYLLQRVKRIVYNNNKSLNNMEKIFIAGCIFITASLSLVYAQANKKVAPASGVSSSVNTAYVPQTFKPGEVAEGTAVSFSDNHPSKPRTHYVFKKDGVLYETYGDRTWMKVNGQFIPQTEWNKYNMIIDQLIAEYHQSAGLYDTIPVQALKEAEIARKKSEMDALLQKQLILEAEKKSLQAKKAQMEAEQKNMEAEKLQKQQQVLELERKNLQLEKEKLEIEQKNRQLKLEKPVVADKAQAAANARVSIKSETNTDKEHIVTGLSYSGSDSDPNAPDTRKMDIARLTQDIIVDLQNEKVITKKEGLSYQLSNESLIVNGAVQPAAVHEKLKAKYIKSPDWKMMYNWRIK